MIRYRTSYQCHSICISRQSLGHEFEEEETEFWILEIHLPYFIVVDLQKRSGLLAYDGLRSCVLLVDQTQLADDFALFEHNVGFYRAKAPVEHEQNLCRGVALAKKGL